MYLLKNMIQKYALTPVFNAELLKIAKIRKQFKYPSTEEWIKRCSSYIQQNVNQSFKIMK